MQKVARMFSSFSAPGIYTERASTAQKSSDRDQLIAVALFSGIGLLVSLVAVIAGVPGSWF